MTFRQMMGMNNNNNGIQMARTLRFLEQRLLDEIEQ